MASEVVKGLLEGLGIQVVVAWVSNVARQARDSHELMPGSALMLAQGLAAGSLLASLQKENQPINLQLECDGPLRGMFVDAQPDGKLRGYVKNRYVEFEGKPGPYHYRPILGNKGFLSVLRDLGGGEFYRSSVELLHFDVSQDLQVFFNQSEQATTRVHVEVLSDPKETFDAVVGILLQALPGGEASWVETWALSSKVLHPEGASSRPTSAGALAQALFSEQGFVPTQTVKLEYACRCTREKMMDALRLLGEEELKNILAEEGKSEARCQFCGKRYVAQTSDLQTLLELFETQRRN